MCHRTNRLQLKHKVEARHFQRPDTATGQEDRVSLRLVNLDGEAVGVNIARSGRTETYALDVQTVTDLLFDLRSGKLAPRRPELEAAKITAPAQ